MSRHTVRTMLVVLSATSLGLVGACGGEDEAGDRTPTGAITEGSGAIWSDEAPPPPSSVDVSGVNGAIWAAFVADPDPLGTTEMNGAFVAAP
jgi:hypothetical protein